MNTSPLIPKCPIFDIYRDQIDSAPEKIQDRNAFSRTLTNIKIMRSPLPLLVVLVLTGILFLPSPVQARVYVNLGLGGCCYYPGYNYGYYPPYYAPPLVYAAPVAPPPVVYVTPPAQTTIYETQSAQLPAQPPQEGNTVTVDPNGQTYIDSNGRTCRQYRSASASGMACLGSDGAWHPVP